MWYVVLLFCFVLWTRDAICVVSVCGIVMFFLVCVVVGEECVECVRCTCELGFCTCAFCCVVVLFCFVLWTWAAIFVACVCCIQ